MAAAVDPRVLRPKNITAGAGDYASLFGFEEWHKMAILCQIVRFLFKGGGSPALAI